MALPFDPDVRVFFFTGSASDSSVLFSTMGTSLKFPKCRVVRITSSERAFFRISFWLSRNFLALIIIISNQSSHKDKHLVPIMKQPEKTLKKVKNYLIRYQNEPKNVTNRLIY